MAAWAGMVTGRTRGHFVTLLPPPRSNSGEQRPSMKELESQPFLVQLITMNNTTLITSYCSLQVLKVLCTDSMASLGWGAEAALGCSGLCSLAVCWAQHELRQVLTVHTYVLLNITWELLRLLLQTEQHVLFGVFCFITTENSYEREAEHI